MKITTETKVDKVTIDLTHEESLLLFSFLEYYTNEYNPSLLEDEFYLCKQIRVNLGQSLNEAQNI